MSCESLFRIDDEHAAHGLCGQRVRMNHVVECGDRAICLGNDREIHCRVLRVVDVIDPLFVLLNRVNADRDRLYASLSKFALERSGFAQFSRADRREICAVREQNDPRISSPLVKVDCALSGVLCEVWGGVAEAKC